MKYVTIIGVVVSIMAAIFAAVLLLENKAIHDTHAPIENEISKHTLSPQASDEEVEVQSFDYMPRMSALETDHIFNLMWMNATDRHFATLILRENSVDDIKIAANTKDSIALYISGIIAEHGLTDRPVDKDEARRLFDMTCKRNNLRACHSLATLIISNPDAEYEQNELMRIYKKACLGRYLPSCAAIGHAYNSEPSKTSAFVTLIRTLRTRCNAGQTDGCSSLGFIYFYNDKIDAETGLALSEAYFAKACEAKDMMGCANIGMRHLNEGNGRQALPYFEEACDAGWVSACFQQGMIYDKGVGVQVDIRLANDYYQKACDSAFPPACHRYAMSLRDGDGVEVGATEARSLFQDACSGGVLDSCIMLASMYDHSEGGSKNEAKAAKIYQSACNSGSSDSCQRLAMKYQYGEGVQRNKAMMRELLERACELRNDINCDTKDSTR